MGRGDWGDSVAVSFVRLVPRASVVQRISRSELSRDGRRRIRCQAFKVLASSLLHFLSILPSSDKFPLRYTHVNRLTLDMKRSSDAFGDKGTVLKRQKLAPSSDRLLRIRHRQPGALELVENSQDASIFDRELSRAICVGLHCAGFNAVKSSALESFRGAVEECTIRPAPRSLRRRG